MGLPAICANGLPGSLVEEYLAGITHNMFIKKPPYKD